MINVTEPFLPPIDEYKELLEGIWQRNWLTNNGPLVCDLEKRLKDYLKLDYLLFLNNGTIAIQIAINALGLKDEIITTPFSFVATTSSIVWEKCTPVFVDIDSETLNIDPKKIESAITSKTTGILATHVYGNPCYIEAIEIIAKKHNLKVIYDGAHCFGTKYKNSSLFKYGDVTTASFHATKLYHTIEGGAVVTTDAELHNGMDLMRNFGHNGPEKFDGVGINGKNSEFHAAMGLVNLKYIDEIIAKRKSLCDYYDLKLKSAGLQRPKIAAHTEYNYAYYPVIFEDETQLLNCVNQLNANGICPRRYFYPSLNKISYTNGNYEMPVSESISKRVLCLPLSNKLTFEQIDKVCDVMQTAPIIDAV